jgi:hypothetical protein
MDSISGTLSWESEKYSIYATPFWEDNENIPISIVDSDGNEFDCYSIKQEYVTSEDDIDDYLETYYEKISKITSKVNKRVELEELLPLIMKAKGEIEFNCIVNGRFLKSINNLNQIDLYAIMIEDSVRILDILKRRYADVVNSVKYNL